MNRPDEIAALPNDQLISGFAREVLCRDRGLNNEPDLYIAELTRRLSATSPGDAVLEALRRSAEGWTNAIELGLLPPQHVMSATILRDEAQEALAALAPAEKAGDELKVACASCKKIPGPHCQRPTCAFRDYIDTRTVKTVLAMTSSELSVIPASAVESGREMARQAIASTPTPPSADVVRYRHKKRGTTYTKIGNAKGQSSFEEANLRRGVHMIEGVTFVVYRADDDGSLWVRQRSEFDDGRFELIQSAAPGDGTEEVEGSSALEAKDAEIARLTDWIQCLQTALSFWMPGVDLRLDDATRELAADDAYLLAGSTGERDIPCWGDGMLERALTAESRISDLERQLAEETERCAQIAYSVPVYMGNEGPLSPGSPYDRGRFDAAAAIRGGAK